MNGVNIELGLDGVISEIKGGYEKYKENKTYNKEAYDELLAKYASAITVIESLKNEIENMKKSTLPSKNEIESLGAFMNLMGIDKLDADGVNKLKNLGEQFGNK